MSSNKRVEKHPPKIWDLPFDIRRQLSGRGGRQRALAADNHLLIVLYQVSKPKSSRGETVYFWRNREHEWHYSERGGGFSALEKVVESYGNRIAELEESLSTADDSRARFQLLDDVTPVLRSVRNLADALHKGLELSDQQTLAGPSIKPGMTTNRGHRNCKVFVITLSRFHALPRSSSPMCIAQSSLLTRGNRNFSRTMYANNRKRLTV